MPSVTSHASPSSAPPAAALLLPRDPLPRCTLTCSISADTSPLLPTAYPSSISDSSGNRLWLLPKFYLTALEQAIWRFYDSDRVVEIAAAQILVQLPT